MCGCKINKQEWVPGLDCQVFDSVNREYMVGAEMDKVYPVRLRKLKGRALASPLQSLGRAQ